MATGIATVTRLRCRSGIGRMGMAVVDMRRLLRAQPVARRKCLSGQEQQNQREYAGF